MIDNNTSNHKAFFIPQAINLQYTKEIQKLVQVLNSFNFKQYEKKSKQIIRSIKNLDKKLFQNISMQCKTHILFTRHGRSQNWNQKKWGLFPNAKVAVQSIQAMETNKTNTYTQNLLYFGDKQILHIGVSPLIRAKQTACLVKPYGFKTYVHIESILCQNSEWPSGDSVTSAKEVEEQYEQLSFLKNPIQTVFLKMSLTFYGGNQIYDEIKKQSIKTDKILIQNAINSIELCQNEQLISKQDQIKNHSFYKNAKYNSTQNIHIFETKSLTRQHKVSQIYKSILKQEYEEYDYWLFGHSNNFTSFFKHYFEIFDKFMYCQTRSIYKLQQPIQDSYVGQNREGKHKKRLVLFHPCYDFYIDQDNGMIRGIFAPDRCKIYLCT